MAKKKAKKSPAADGRNGRLEAKSAVECLREALLTTGMMAIVLKMSQQTVIREFDNIGGSLDGHRIGRGEFRRCPRENVIRFARVKRIQLPRICLLVAEGAQQEVFDAVNCREDMVVLTASTLDAPRIVEECMPDLVVYADCDEPITECFEDTTPEEQGCPVIGVVSKNDGSIVEDGSDGVVQIVLRRHVKRDMAKAVKSALKKRAREHA